MGKMHLSVAVGEQGSVWEQEWGTRKMKCSYTNPI